MLNERLKIIETKVRRFYLFHLPHLSRLKGAYTVPVSCSEPYPLLVAGRNPLKADQNHQNQSLSRKKCNDSSEL